MISLKGLIPHISFNNDQSNKYLDKDKVIEIKFTGLKQGEKLFEELMIEDNPKNLILEFSISEKT